MADPYVAELIDAILEQDANRVAHLLEAGVDPNARGDDGTTALYSAAGHAEIARLLLHAGAQPNEESLAQTEGMPLCAAACWGATDAIRELLADGADPNLAEDQGDGLTPLVWAVTNIQADATRELLTGGADPNLHPRGNVPLVVAAERGSLAIVQALLDYGADPVATDALGHTALQVAQEWIGKDISKELQARLEPLPPALQRPDTAVTIRREEREGGAELIEVHIGSASGGISASRETGHAQIVELLSTHQ